MRKKEMDSLKKRKKTGDFQEYLLEVLKDPAEAQTYLNAALEDEDYRVFLLALRNVAEAFGITSLAEAADLNRENIYRMLSAKGNPRISSLVALLRAVGVQLKTEIAPQKPARSKSVRSPKTQKPAGSRNPARIPA